MNFVADVEELSALIAPSVLKAAAPPSRPKPRVGKRMLWVMLAIFATVGGAQLIYTLSGSGEWKYVEKKQGIALYSMKVPGANVKKFLAVFRIKSTLNQAVYFMQDDDSDVADVGFYDSSVLKEESALVRTTTWKWHFPRPMADREFVVKHSYSQDPKTHEVLYKLDAQPDMLPEDSCCVRVRRMANSWRLVPLKNGEVEIHWVMDVDFGGWIPYFMMNKRLAWEMFDFGSSLQEIVSRKRYIGAQTGWVKELQPEL
jgi:hypothetical protein